MRHRATIALAAAGATLPALAHHSTSMYDRSAPITIEAEVAEFRWVNPHSITLKFGPLRNGDQGGIFLQATLADGKVMTYSTELPTE